MVYESNKRVSIVFLYLVIALGVVLQSCNRKECDVSGMYQFVLPASVSPAMDTFYVGDTIHIISSFRDNVLEAKTGNEYELNNWEFYPMAAITALDTFPANHAAARNFQVFSEGKGRVFTQSLSSGNYFIVGEYQYDNEYYDLTFGLVPNKTGLYFFSMGSGVYPSNEFQEFEGKCNGKGSEAFIVMNDDDNNNYGFFEDAIDSVYAEKALVADKHGKSGYVFYVKE